MMPQRLSNWMEGLHAGLVQRLAHPLYQPGLINFAKGHATLKRSAQMAPNLPLTDMLMTRWAHGRANASASSVAGQLPIVYVQPAPASAPSAETPAISAQPAQPSRNQPTGRSPQASMPPVVQAIARAPVAPSSADMPVAIDKSLPTLPIAPATPSALRPEPTWGPVSEAPPRSRAASSTLSQEMTHPLIQTAEAEHSTGSANVVGAEGVIQRMPVQKRPASLPLVRPHEPAATAVSPPFAQPQSTISTQLAANSRARASHTAAPESSLQTVRPVASAAKAQSSRLANMPGAVQSAAFASAASPLATATLPVVRVRFTPAPMAGSSQAPPWPATSAATARPAAPPTGPVVQANANQPASLPPRGAVSTPAGADGLLQRTALPLAQSNSARPTPSTGTPQRAAGVNRTVIQRMPAQVIQRVGEEDQRGGQDADANELDIEAIVDRVQRQFMRRLEVERERRGGTSWR